MHYAFHLFINDIFNRSANVVLTKLYADNFKLISTSLISTDDSYNLQDVLSNFLVWSKG